jgi:L-alanine-DL-glutamate epimerase-like enolase superfamily enzyme
MTALPIESISTQLVSVPYEVVRVIARGTETHARMVEVNLVAAGVTGRGEAHATPRFGETDAAIVEAIERVSPELKRGCSRADLQVLLGPGPARNAIDCALWDLESKLFGRYAESIAGLEPLYPVVTAYTISLQSPQAMAQVAAAQCERPLLKVKLGRFDEDRARLEAVRRAAPKAELIADANEGWTFAQLQQIAPVARDLGVALIEQPLHADHDDALCGYRSPVPLCADESCHSREALSRAVDGYAFVNIKLDKTGGLTEALALSEAARALGLGVMVGCTSGRTLAMAPGYLVAQTCRYVDLDSPMYLPPEQNPEVGYDGSRIDWSTTRRWGVPRS